MSNTRFREAESEWMPTTQPNGNNNNNNNNKRPSSSPKQPSRSWLLDDDVPVYQEPVQFTRVRHLSNTTSTAKQQQPPPPVQPQVQPSPLMNFKLLDLTSFDEAELVADGSRSSSSSTCGARVDPSEFHSNREHAAGHPFAHSTSSRDAWVRFDANPNNYNNEYYRDRQYVNCVLTTTTQESRDQDPDCEYFDLTAMSSEEITQATTRSSLSNTTAMGQQQYYYREPAVGSSKYLSHANELDEHGMHPADYYDLTVLSEEEEDAFHQVFSVVSHVKHVHNHKVLIDVEDPPMEQVDIVDLTANSAPDNPIFDLTAMGASLSEDEPLLEEDDDDANKNGSMILDLTQAPSHVDDYYQEDLYPNLNGVRSYDSQVSAHSRASSVASMGSRGSYHSSSRGSFDWMTKPGPTSSSCANNDSPEATEEVEEEDSASNRPLTPSMPNVTRGDSMDIIVPHAASGASASTAELQAPTPAGTDLELVTSGSALSNNGHAQHPGLLLEPHLSMSPIPMPSSSSPCSSPLLAPPPQPPRSASTSPIPTMGVSPINTSTPPPPPSRQSSRVRWHSPIEQEVGSNQTIIMVEDDYGERPRAARDPDGLKNPPSSPSPVLGPYQPQEIFSYEEEGEEVTFIQNDGGRSNISNGLDQVEILSDDDEDDEGRSAATSSSRSVASTNSNASSQSGGRLSVPQPADEAGVPGVMSATSFLSMLWEPCRTPSDEKAREQQKLALQQNDESFVLGEELIRNSDMLEEEEEYADDSDEDDEDEGDEDDSTAGQSNNGSVRSLTKRERIDQIRMKRKRRKDLLSSSMSPPTSPLLLPVDAHDQVQNNDGNYGNVDESTKDVDSAMIHNLDSKPNDKKKKKKKLKSKSEGKGADKKKKRKKNKKRNKKKSKKGIKNNGKKAEAESGLIMTWKRVAASWKPWGKKQNDLGKKRNVALFAPSSSEEDDTDLDSKTRREELRRSIEKEAADSVAGGSTAPEMSKWSSRPKGKAGRKAREDFRRKRYDGNAKTTFEQDDGGGFNLSTLLEDDSENESDDFDRLVHQQTTAAAESAIAIAAASREYTSPHHSFSDAEKNALPFDIRQLDSGIEDRSFDNNEVANANQGSSDDIICVDYVAEDDDIKVTFVDEKMAGLQIGSNPAKESSLESNKAPLPQKDLVVATAPQDFNWLYGNDVQMPEFVQTCTFCPTGGCCGVWPHAADADTSPMSPKKDGDSCTETNTSMTSPISCWSPSGDSATLKTTPSSDKQVSPFCNVPESLYNDSVFFAKPTKEDVSNNDDTRAEPSTNPPADTINTDMGLVSPSPPPFNSTTQVEFNQLDESGTNDANQQRSSAPSFCYGDRGFCTQSPLSVLCTGATQGDDEVSHIPPCEDEDHEPMTSSIAPVSTNKPKKKKKSKKNKSSKHSNLTKQHGSNISTSNKKNKAAEAMRRKQDLQLGETFEGIMQVTEDAIALLSQANRDDSEMLGSRYGKSNEERLTPVDIPESPTSTSGVAEESANASQTSSVFTHDHQSLEEITLSYSASKEVETWSFDAEVKSSNQKSPSRKPSVPNEQVKDDSESKELRTAASQNNESTVVAEALQKASQPISNFMMGIFGVPPRNSERDTKPISEERPSDLPTNIQPNMKNSMERPNSLRSLESNDSDSDVDRRKPTSDRSLSSLSVSMHENRNQQSENKASSNLDRKRLEQIVSDLMAHPYGFTFSSPVDKGQFPDYSNVVKIPMDLGTILKKLLRSGYPTLLDFHADVSLTFDNAMSYNPEGSEVYGMAMELKEIFETQFLELLDELEAELLKKEQEQALVAI